MLLLLIFCNMIKTSEKSNVGQVIGSLDDTLSIINDNNNSENFLEMKTKKNIDAASENLRMLMTIMGNSEDKNDLKESLDYLSKTDKDIREKYKSMTLKELEDKIIDLKRLYDNERRKMNEKLGSANYLSEQGDENVLEMEFKRSGFIAEDSYNLEGNYNILNDYKEEIYHYTTLTYYRFFDEKDKKNMCESSEQKSIQELVKN